MQRADAAIHRDRNGFRSQQPIPRKGAVPSGSNARVAAVVARVARARLHPRVFYEVDATGGYYTAGPGTYIDALIRMAELWARLADRAEAKSPSRWPERRRDADAA